MLFSFKKKPADVCKKLLRQFELLKAEKGAEQLEKLNAKILKLLMEIRTMLYGDDENEPRMGDIRRFRDEFMNRERKTFIELVRTMASLTPPCQNEIVKIFNFFVYRGKQNKFIKYILSNRVILDYLMKGLDDEKAVVYYSSMLIECLKHKDLANEFLDMDRVAVFVGLAASDHADLAMEGFKILRILLLTHPAISIEFIQTNYDAIFKTHFASLLGSENYFAIIKTLTLCFDILIHFMSKPLLTRYVNEVSFLVQVMKLLNTKKLNLQTAAYNMFKLFVGNCQKSAEIKLVLRNNEEVLTAFLTKFKLDDANYETDQKYLLEQLAELRGEEKGRPAES